MKLNNAKCKNINKEYEKELKRELRKASHEYVRHAYAQAFVNTFDTPKGCLTSLGVGFGIQGVVGAAIKAGKLVLPKPVVAAIELGSYYTVPAINGTIAACKAMHEVHEVAKQRA